MQKFISLFLILSLGLPSQVLFAASDSESEPDPEELRHAIDEAMGAVRNVQQELPAVRQEAQRGIDAYNQSVGDRIKWQNTLRGSFEVPNVGRFGVYNRDVINIADMGVHIGMSYYLYRQMYKARIAHVQQVVLSQSAAICDWLKKLAQAEKSDLALWEKKGFFAKLFSRKKPTAAKTLSEFKRYIKNSQQLIGYNPFKKQLLFPLGANIAVTQTSGKIKENLLYGKFRDEAFNRYEMRDGRLVQMANPPISVVPFLGVIGSFITNPVMSTLLIPFLSIQIPYLIARDYIGEQNITAGKRLGARFFFPQFFVDHPHIANFIFSKPFSILLQTLTTAYALKGMDSWYDKTWINYILKNHEQFYKLLRQYEKIKKKHETNPDDKQVIFELKKSEDAIHAFIIDGHVIKSIIPGASVRGWFSNAKSAAAWPGTIVFLAGAGYLYYKFRQMNA